ncbi:MAG TPA: hypothetical protein VKB79_30170 [Bryobacteraceae bacterium]|nr:hypothetical protein [Bryobacteraceae bacterium]
MNEHSKIDTRDEVLPSVLKKETEKPEGEEISHADLEKIAGGTIKPITKSVP